MLNEGRLLGDGICIVEHYARLLREAGVPLQRANIAQLLANPLLAAWWKFLVIPALGRTYVLRRDKKGKAHQK